MARLKTGIVGLDHLFDGGILKGSMILVKGSPGAGKTTLGMEFVYRGARDFGEAGVILSFEQFPASLYRDASNFGWDLPALEKEKRLRVICTSPEVVLDPESNFLDEVVREIGAERILIDSMSHFRQATSNSLKLRQAVYAFCNGLRRLGVTAMLVKEQEHDDDGLHSFEEFLVDGVISLGYGGDEDQLFRRTIEVTKSRGQAHIAGKHTFKILPHGLEVYTLPPLTMPETVHEEREVVPTGIKGLDELLRGGIPRGISVIVNGGVGTGKTVLGMEFLVQGARQGETGLYLSFEEAPAQIASHASAFDWRLEELRRQGLVDLIFTPLDHADFDEFACRVWRYLKERRVRRLVFDSLPDLISPIRDPVILKQKFFTMLTYLYSLQCTTIFLYPTSGNHEQDPQLQIVQSLVQGVILLKSSLARHQRIRQLEIYKLRGVAHISGDHLMEISESGVLVYPRVGGW